MVFGEPLVLQHHTASARGKRSVLFFFFFYSAARIMRLVRHTHCVHTHRHAHTPLSHLESIGSSLCHEIPLLPLCTHTLLKCPGETSIVADFLCISFSLDLLFQPQRDYCCPHNIHVFQPEPQLRIQKISRMLKKT